MSKFLDRREDGSIALFIDGDLQFDSRDEQIYHECLALPALGLSENRVANGALKALIVGGGDGLVARELLKSPAVERIDLVDYDAEVLDLARSEFAHINLRSLSNERLNVHIEDAWEFVERAVFADDAYDLIISDLTVASDVDGARFHSVEWYRMLDCLLQPEGILSTNAASPWMTPQAYWSIVNSMRTAGLSPLPYHIVLRSFVSLGYGPDWGFVLAASRPIRREELAKIEMAKPRFALKDVEHVTKLFSFPAEIVASQGNALPASSGSEILLEYLNNPEPLEVRGSDRWNSLDARIEEMPLPAPDQGVHLMPIQLRELFIEADQRADKEEEVFQSVLELMPALQRFQTRELIADFLSNPGAFLEALDLGELVSILLRRAAELPARVVDELLLLKDKLVAWTGEYFPLYELGSRALTIITLVVVLGNLMYPDAAYGKGGHGGGGHGGDHGGHAGGRGGDHGDRGAGARGDRGDRAGDRGDRGDRGFGHNGWNHGNHFDHHFDHHWDHYGAWGGWARSWHRGWWGGNGGWGWGGWGWGWPAYGAGGGFLNFNLGLGGGGGGSNNNNNTTNNYTSVNEEGNQYPARSYQYNPDSVQNYNWNSDNNDGGPAPDQGVANDNGRPQTSVKLAQQQAPYRLGPDTDILPDGKIVMQLTDKAYLMLTGSQTLVMDQTTGKPVLALYNDPSLIWHLNSEIKRQQAGLQSAQQNRNSASDWTGNLGFSAQKLDDQSEAQGMQAAQTLLGKAQQMLGQQPDSPPPPPQPPVQGAMEVFANTWMMPDGSYLIVRRPDSSLAYMDGKGWYSDQGKTKIAQAYPTGFKTVVVSYLTNLTQQADAAKSGLTQDQQEAQSRMTVLNQDFQQLQNNQQQLTNGSIAYESDDTPNPEKARRLKQAMRRTQNRLNAIQRQLDAMPVEVAAANKLIAALQS